MTITGLSGKIGSGKSLEMTRFVLEQAEKKQLSIVTNYSLNFHALIAYARHKKYWWIMHLIDKGKFTVLDTMESLEDLLEFPNSMIAFDEAGIFCNARDFKSTSKKMLMDLCQSRKLNANLVWASQFDSQVDIQFRNLTQYWIHCAGASRYDQKLKRPKLIWKCYYYFDAEAYNLWLYDPKAKGSYIRTRFNYATTVSGGPLNKSDKLLFNCFDSFARLDKQKQNVVFAAGQNCPLARDYYFNKLGLDYAPERDPFSKVYQPPAPPPRPEVPSDWQSVGNGLEVYQAPQREAFPAFARKGGKGAADKLAKFRKSSAGA